MEFVKLLLRSDDERARFAADPDATLAHHGLAGLSPADVHDAVLFVEDTLTVDWSPAYGAAHTAPAESVAALDTTGWWTPEEPDHSVPPEHLHAPEFVDDALYEAPDLHFGH